MVYKSCEDYSLFIDGHVESLTFNRCIYVLRKSVDPTQKKMTTYLSTKFYQLLFATRKQPPILGNLPLKRHQILGGTDERKGTQVPKGVKFTPIFGAVELSIYPIHER